MSKNKKNQNKNQSAQATVAKQKHKWMPWLIFAFACLLYSNTIDNGYVMDDGAVITDNATTRMGYKGMKQFFKESSVYGATKENYGTYRPLTMATYAFEYDFYKMKVKPGVPTVTPKGQRLTHIALYGLCCLLLFWVLTQLLNNYHPLLPFVATLLFAAHPLHTEVAAFIKSRDELLSLTFLLSSILFFLQYIDDRKTNRLVFANLFFLCASFSKEGSIVFVVLIPLALYFFRSMNFKQVLNCTWGLAVCAFVYLYARYNVLDANKGFMPVINNTLVEASGLGEKFATIFYVLLQNIKMLFYPIPLTWDYGYNQIPLQQFSNLFVIASVLIHCALAFFGLKGLKARKIGSYFILFYFATIALTSNAFVLISAVMAERFLFIPSIAFCVMAAYFLLRFLSSGNELKQNTTVFAIIIPVVFIFSIMTYNRNYDWQTNYTLFKSGAEASPNSYRTNSAYAWEVLKKAEQEKDPNLKKQYLLESEGLFRKAISIWSKQYLDHYNLAVVLNYQNKEASRDSFYLSSFALNPKYINSVYNLGVAYYVKKDYPKAKEYWSKAVGIDGNFMDLNFKMGLINQYLNDMQQAILFYEKFFANHQNNADVINNLMICYKAVGNIEKSNQMAVLLKKYRK